MKTKEKIREELRKTELLIIEIKEFLEKEVMHMEDEKDALYDLDLAESKKRILEWVLKG